MKSLISHAKLYALVFAALLIAAAQPALAQHEGHDMSKPAASKPRPKRKPRPKPATAKRKQPAQARPVQADANEADEAEASGPAPVASPAPVESTAPSPESPNVHKHDAAPPATPALAPTAVPVKSEAPSATSSPEAGEAPTAAPHRHDAGGAASPPRPSSGEAMESMKGMVHPPSATHAAAGGDPHALMVMADGMMDIRVGLKQYNFIAMGQMGSGTSWQPSTTPMYMWSKVTDKWLLFIHGEAKMGVNSQGGPRGVTKFESQNWVMPMAFRRVGPGTLQLRGMFSLEPFTFSPGGSPQLFQTGETYQGRPIVDAQHPHDLFM